MNGWIENLNNTSDVKGGGTMSYLIGLYVGKVVKVLLFSVIVTLLLKFIIKR